MMCINSVAATCNVMVITDPTGKDPNGAAAGSMSFADNMFQSTFLMSKEHSFCGSFWWYWWFRLKIGFHCRRSCIS